MKKATKIFQNNNWQFNQYVTKIFDAHVKQSIPFYSISHDLTVKLSEFSGSEKINLLILKFKASSISSYTILAIGKFWHISAPIPTY